MTIEEGIAYFGSGYRMCKELGLTPQCLTNWRRVGYIPMYQQLRLEKMTKGQLRADQE